MEELEKAGGWVKKRHHLSIRSPEGTSAGRASAFNRVTVGAFFDNLASVQDEYHFRPADIYNMDETACMTVQNPGDVVAEKGKKQVGSLTSRERGELVSAVYTVNAAGNVVPPMLVFPRVNLEVTF